MFVTYQHNYPLNISFISYFTSLKLIKNYKSNRSRFKALRFSDNVCDISIPRSFDSCTARISYLMSHSLISLRIKQKHPIWKEHMGQNDRIIHISLYKESSHHLTIACVSYLLWHPLNWLKIKTSWGWALPS